MAIIKLTTPIFRVAFPSVFEPKAIGNSPKKKYYLTMLFTLAEIAKDPAEKKKWDDLMMSAKLVAEEKWPKGLPKGLANPFQDGMQKQEYDGYGAGVKYLNTSTTTRPGLIDAAKNKIEDPSDFYGGCYARATVNPYAWEFMGKVGVSFGLQNIQKVREGEPFGGRTRAEDDFDALAATLSEDTPPADTENLFV